MIKHIHVHQKVEKTIEQMSGLDNAPMIAASRARDIIQSLSDGILLKTTKRLAAKKDARLKNILKFDLGKGYRLISIREKDSIYILFIGTHDQCDRWLYVNRKKRIHMNPIPIISYKVNHEESAMNDSNLSSQSSECNTEDSCDDSIQIPQAKLRTVFCGLVEQSY